MFWRRPPEAQLLRYLTPSPAGPPARISKALEQLEKLLRGNSALNLNAEFTWEGPNNNNSKGSALTLALEHPTWSNNPDLQLQLIQLLLKHEAAPLWPLEASQKSHYIMALERGRFEAAEAILERGAQLAGEDDGCYGAVMVTVFKAALSVHLLPGSEENPTLCPISSHVVAQKEPGEEREHAESENTDSNSSKSEGKRAAADEEANQLPSELSTPAMLAAAWLIESRPEERIARMQPGGAPSVVHAILAAFAEQVEDEARRKHAAASTLVTLPQPQRQFEEEHLKQQRSDAVACLLQRLWALLQLALAAGSPAVSAEVSKFPASPMRPLCDLDLVWSGVKKIATAWMPRWDRDNHCMYHPAFKSAVKAFVLAASRGLSVRSRAGEAGGSTERRVYILDSSLVERIVGFIATDQKAWVPVI